MLIPIFLIALLFLGLVFFLNQSQKENLGASFSKDSLKDARGFSNDKYVACVLLDDNSWLEFEVPETFAVTPTSSATDADMYITEHFGKLGKYTVYKDKCPK